MMNFILLIMLPMAFIGALIAIFMYCSHYLFVYARDAVAQIANKHEETAEPPVE